VDIWHERPIRACVIEGGSADGVGRGGGQTSGQRGEEPESRGRTGVRRHEDVNGKQAGGATALHRVAKWDDLETADLLLRTGASTDVANDLGVTPLSLARVNSSAGMVQQSGTNPNAPLRNGETPLMIAARTGTLELVAALLAHGADSNARLKKAPPRYGYFDLRLNLAGVRPFFLAAMAADREVMQLLVDRGADPLIATDEQTTPLMAAAGVGRTEGVSPVTESGAIEAVKLTLQLGGKVTDTNALGNTALHGASYLGWNALIQFIVDNGANVNAINRQQETPLLIAEGKAERLSLAITIHEARRRCCAMWEPTKSSAWRT
jgi:ankyrin repeat protein